MGSSATQFGATAAVDSQGVVHLVYSDRQADSDSLEPTRLSAVRRWLLDGPGCQWRPTRTPGTRCSPRSPSMTPMASTSSGEISDSSRLKPAPRCRPTPISSSSDLVEGEWTEPTQINIREAPEVNPAWPHLAVDGDRLVVVWSIYRGTTAEEMKSAVRVEWSTRPLDASSAWSAPQTLYVREGGDAGGRLIDLAADPRGGAVVVYGLYNRSNNDLFMQRLEPEQAHGPAPVLIASGDYGYLPDITIGDDGTIYAVFNNGRNRDVDIGGLIADPSGRAPGP